jgi:hypothetical protein
MDLKKIPRREKRLYRKIKKGKVVYSKTPLEKKKVEKKTKKHKNLDKPKTSSQKEPFEKTVVIENILTELSENLNPDIDTISSMIYNQLKQKNINIDENTVKNVVNNTEHYRASRKKDYDVNDPASKIIKELSNELPEEEKKPLTRAEQRERISTIVDNLYDQIEKENIKDQEKQEKAIKQENIRKKEKINKKKPKKKTQEKKVVKEEDELDFDEEDLDEDVPEDISDEDDLGLKF